MDIAEHFQVGMINPYVCIKPITREGEEALQDIGGFRQIAGLIFVEHSLFSHIEEALSEYIAAKSR